MSSRALDLGLAANSFVTVLPDLSSLPNVGDVLSVKTVSGGMVATGFNAPSGVGAFLPLTGGTMTGSLILSANPTAPLGAATMQWVQAQNGAYLPLTGGALSGPLTVNGVYTLQTQAVFAPGAQSPNQGIKSFINVGVAGTGVTGLGYVHSYLCSGDQAQFTGAQPNGPVFFNIQHNFGGGATQGWRTTAEITQTMIGTTTNKAAGINPINVTLMLNQAVQTGDGGTGLQNTAHPNSTGSPQNASTALGIQSTLYSGAVNQGGQLGMEIDVGVQSGGSVLSKKGLLICKWSFDAFQSLMNDCAISIADQAGATVGWTTGIRFGAQDAQWPIDPANGSIIGAVYSRVQGAQARYGLDFSDVAFPAFGTTRLAGALVSNNFAIDGVGAMMLGSTYLTPSSTGLAIDTKGIICTGATVAAGGSGYAVNDILYDPYGGMWRVTTLSGTAVSAVSVYTDANSVAHYGNYPSATPPTNPVATTAWEWAAGISTGCTLNLTWNTTATALSLQPSGGTVMVNGGCTISSGSAAPAATQPAGSIYMRTGGASGARLYVSAGGGTWTAITSAAGA